MQLDERTGEERPTATADEWLARLEAIKREVLRIPEEDLPEWTEKQALYFRAFALREEL